MEQVYLSETPISWVFAVPGRLGKLAARSACPHPPSIDARQCRVGEGRPLPGSRVAALIDLIAPDDDDDGDGPAQGRS